MATPQVEYRHEYVSGMLFVRRFPGLIAPQIVNRGHTDGHVRVLVWRYGIKHPVIDSGDELLSPRLLWRDEREVIDLEVEVPRFWVQIFTTSPSLIPSLEFAEMTDGEDGEFSQSVYFAPGDFAVFALDPPSITSPRPPRPIVND